jgi:transposase
VVALTYRVTVDVPARFRNSKAVGAVFGLTPAKYQSGEIDRTGPSPESRTATSTLRESTVFITNSRTPSLAAHIASTALMIRFRITCCS